PRTDRAVPAILSGARPARICPPTVKEYPQNLFTLLGATGRYQLTAFEPLTGLCPGDRLRDRAQPDAGTQWMTVIHAVGAVYLHDLVPEDLPIETPRVPRTWFGLGQVLQIRPDQQQGVVKYSWDFERNTQFEHF